MITNILFGAYFKELRIARALSIEDTLAGMGLPQDDLWSKRLAEAEEKGVFKQRFIKKMMAFYGVTNDNLDSITEKARQKYLRTSDTGRIISFIDDIMANGELIRTDPRFSNIIVGGALIQSPYIGGGALPLGVLLKLWAGEGPVCVCEKCGGKVYMFGALFALSTSNHYGYCAGCGRYAKFESGRPQYDHDHKYIEAWNLLSGWRKKNKNAEKASVKAMLLEILKNRNDFEGIVREFHLEDEDDELFDDLRHDRPVTANLKFHRHKIFFLDRLSFLV